MKAILKEIRTGYFDEFYHKITMCFSKSIESDELYFFNTSLEHQFCTDEERIAGLSEDLVEEKVCYANTLIGRWFEINLYKISIKEISNQHYIALEIFNDEECIKEIHRLSGSHFYDKKGCYRRSKIYDCKFRKYRRSIARWYY